MKITLNPMVYAKAKNCRDYTLKLFGTNRLTLTHMKEEMFANIKALEGLDRFFIIEMGFLNEKAETLLVSRVQNSVFEAMPTDISEKSFGQVLTKLDNTTSWESF